MILAVVEVGREIRLVVGEIVTWYSIEEPQSKGVAVNGMLVAGPLITFWLWPLIVDKSMLMLHTAALEMAASSITLHPLKSPHIPNPVNSYPVGIV